MINPWSACRYIYELPFSHCSDFIHILTYISLAYSCQGHTEIREVNLCLIHYDVHPERDLFVDS